MNKYIVIIIFSLLVIILSGCSQSANIVWDNVKITINSVSKMPSDVDLGRETTHLLSYTVKGNPHDTYRGDDAAQVMNLYDDTGEQCFFADFISGVHDDVVVKGEITVIVAIDCYKNKNTNSILFVFKDSNNEFLDSIGDKFSVKVREEPTADEIILLNDLIKKKENEKQNQKPTLDSIKKAMQSYANSEQR